MFRRKVTGGRCSGVRVSFSSQGIVEGLKLGLAFRGKCQVFGVEDKKVDVQGLGLGSVFRSKDIGGKHSGFGVRVGVQRLMIRISSRDLCVGSKYTEGKYSGFGVRD